MRAKESDTPGRILIKAAKAMVAAEAKIAFCGTFCRDSFPAPIFSRKGLGVSWAI